MLLCMHAPVHVSLHSHKTGSFQATESASQTLLQLLTLTTCPAGAGTAHTGMPESERLRSPSRQRQRTARFKRQTLCRSATLAVNQPPIRMHPLLVHILPTAKTELCPVRPNTTISIRVWRKIKKTGKLLCLLRPSWNIPCVRTRPSFQPSTAFS